MSETSADSGVGTVLGGGGPSGAVADVQLVIRTRLVLRLFGPALGVIGAALLALGSRGGVIVLVIAGAFLLSWLPRVVVTPGQIRARRLLTTTTVEIDAVDAVSLRRVPFGPPRPPHRTYRFGRLSTTPMRLRVIRSEEHVLELTVVWWEGWAHLVRYLVSVPGITTDARNLGRLDRYG